MVPGLEFTTMLPLGDQWLFSNEHEVVKVVGLTLTTSVSEHITPFITLLLKGFK